MLGADVAQGRAARASGSTNRGQHEMGVVWERGQHEGELQEGPLRGLVTLTFRTKSEFPH